MFYIMSLEQDELGCKSIFGVIEFSRQTTREQYYDNRKLFRAQQPENVTYEYVVM